MSITDAELVAALLQPSAPGELDGVKTLAAKRIADLTEWRPMASAPRDGTDVLLVCEDRIYKGGWATSFETGHAAWRTASVPVDGELMCVILKDDAAEGWLPLPPPPSNVVVGNFHHKNAHTARPE